MARGMIRKIQTGYLKNFLKTDKALAMSFSASMGLVLTYLYFFRVEFENFSSRSSLQNDILSHSAESPYRYRVLIPSASNLIIKILKPFLSYEDSFYLSHIMLNFSIITSYLFLSYLTLKHFFEISISLIGIYILGFSLVITLQDHVYQPWSLIEAMLWTATFYFIATKRLIVLPVITIVASLNRETGIFLPLIVLLLQGQIQKSRRFKVFFIAVNFVVSVVIFVGLRVTLSSTYENFQIIDLFARNLQERNVLWTILNLLLLLGINWLFTINRKNVDIFWQKASRVMYFYIPFIILFGVWFEVRLLTPILIIILSTILSNVEKIINGKSI